MAEYCSGTSHDRRVNERENCFGSRLPVNVAFIVVPYDSGRREWRMGKGPEELMRAGLADAAGGGASARTVIAFGEDASPADAMFRLYAGLAEAVAIERDKGL